MERRGRFRRKADAAAGLALAALLFFSCVSTNHYVQVDRLAAAEEFGEGAALLEKDRKTIYRDRDKVLYFLDKGMLTHYAGSWVESSALLQDGERAIEQNYAVSISQEIGTYIFNDTSREYDGEDYEDLYLNVFNALNYYNRGELDEALVEIRRINNKLKNLAVRYGAIMTGMQKMALENKVDIPRNPDAPKEFSNSALARYLGMLFHRGGGNWDDARIDRDGLRLAFADYPSIYNHPVPLSVNGELEIPAGMARLNVMAFAGRIPEKTEETLRIPLGSYSWIKIALPELTPRPSQVSSVKVAFDGGESFSLELLEDIGRVSGAAFSRKKDLIYTKTVMRATIKGVTAAVFNAASGSNSDNAGVYALLGIAAQIFAEASEKADLRSSRYFPGKVYVGAVNLAPGTYSFTVSYYSRNGNLVAGRRFENVPVVRNALNLREAVCLK